MKDLESSSIDRKNILNNNEAILSIYQNIGFIGILFDGKYRFTKQQVASYYEVDVRTIERILHEHKPEVEDSGYEVFTGIKLKQLKDAFDDTDTNVGIITEDGDNEFDSQ